MSATEAHFHTDEAGVLRRCYHKCPSWIKIIALSAFLNLFWEVATMWPVHHLYEHFGLL